MKLHYSSIHLQQMMFIIFVPLCTPSKSKKPQFHHNWLVINSFMTEVPIILEISPFALQINGLVSIDHDLRHERVTCGIKSKKTSIQDLVLQIKQNISKIIAHDYISQLTKFYDQKVCESKDIVANTHHDVKLFKDVGMV